MNKYFMIASEPGKSSSIYFSNKETEQEVINDFIMQLTAENYEIEEEEVPAEWSNEWLVNFYDWYDTCLSSIYNCQTFERAW